MPLVSSLIRSALLAAFVALPAQAFDLQGHRGARGLAPENTLPAYRRALELGVDTLGCDMAITAAGGKIWAPNQGYLTPAMLAEAHTFGIVVIPWTVNDPAMMTKLIEMGIDGIISDRPDLVQVELKKRK
jgi:glycerophosphoryl diester phosphodiesterase